MLSSQIIFFPLLSSVGFSLYFCADFWISWKKFSKPRRHFRRLFGLQYNDTCPILDGNCCSDSLGYIYALSTELPISIWHAWVLEHPSSAITKTCVFHLTDTDLRIFQEEFQGVHKASRYSFPLCKLIAKQPFRDAEPPHPLPPPPPHTCTNVTSHSFQPLCYCVMGRKLEFLTDFVQMSKRETIRIPHEGEVTVWFHILLENKKFMSWTQDTNQ